MANSLKERQKKFTFPPFSFELTLVVSSDITESIAKRANRADYSLAEPGEDVTACVYNLPGGRCLMFMPDHPAMEWIVHESSHVVWAMLHYVGVALDNEIYAYHIGYLAEQVAKFAWGPPPKKGEKPKPKPKPKQKTKK